MKIKIIGSGFSGLTLAYYLKKRGPQNLQIQVIEKSDQPGGLIHSKKFEGYTIETAANAILCNAELESLCEDIALPLLPHLASSKKRFIFVQKPLQFSLPLTHAFLVFSKALWRYIFHRHTFLPQENENVRQWTIKNFSQLTFDHLVEPALQGIHGKNPGELSAHLIIRSLFLNRPKKKSRLKGSVSFQNGLGSFLEHLQKHLQDQGVQFLWKTSYTSSDLSHDISQGSMVALCTHAAAASNILSSVKDKLAQQLKTLQFNSLSSVTIVQKDVAQQPFHGFGVLFPQDQRFNSLGVLFPNDIFEGRGPRRHETWILADATADSNEHLLEKIQNDRLRLFQKEMPIENFHIFHWPSAIPRYDQNLEFFLSHFTQPSPVFLHGNYLGEIGLGKILKRSKSLAEQILQQQPSKSKEDQ